MTTIQTVAKKANVSVATVSRVINNKQNVSEKTKKKVTKVIKELNYTPNLLAKNLRKQKSRHIVILIPSLSNDFYSKVIYGIQQVAEKNGYYAMICSTNGNIEIEREYFRLLFTKLIDGIIITAPQVGKKELENLSENYPIVQCSEYIQGANVSSVTIDNYKATKEAISYLFGIGHTNIAFVGGKSSLISATERKRAYIDSVKNGIIQRESIYEGTYSFKTGEIGAKILIKSMPTAIFCCSDSLAIGVIRGLVEAKIKVGKEISVMGFDGTNIAKYNTPSISTVEQPREEMGRISAEILLEKMKNIKAKNKQIILPHKINICETTNNKIDINGGYYGKNS